MATLCVAALSLTGCAPSTFAAKGTITVTGSVTNYQTDNDPQCHGYNGFDDMQHGAQVTISADGKTVAVGSLDQGVSGDGNTSCTFSFSIADEPGGSKFYSVEVTHRGAMQYSEDQLKSGVGLSLGS